MFGTRLQEITDTAAKNSLVKAKVFDEAVVVQMLHPKTTLTLEVYVETIFVPYLTTQLQTAERLDIVWDTYKDNSLKAK